MQWYSHRFLSSPPGWKCGPWYETPCLAKYFTDVLLNWY